jgi:uroporphyrinogen-III synthase
MSDQTGEAARIDDHAATVVVTRPLAQAEELAQQIVALGRKALLFPLLEIHPLADPAPLQAALAGLSSYALVAFVSPNAIDAAFAHRSGWPAEVALAVMGEGSRAALARHGLTDANATIFRPLNPERSDSETLLEALDIDALRGKKVLILRGESGREWLADRLQEQGIAVTQVAAYRRAAPELSTTRQRQLQVLLEGENDWLVTSSEALRNLDAMVRQSGDADGVVKMQQQRIIVPHARIAETAATLGFLNVLQTGSGDERLLAALQFTL